MACPPNIWSGLYADGIEAVTGSAEGAAGDVDNETVNAAAAWAAKCFGDRMKQLATGGAPTPPHLIHFARQVARRCDVRTATPRLDSNKRCGHSIPDGASLVDSYGATECGAIATDGRQLGSKFEGVRVALVDRPRIGFTAADAPHPRGEVAVSSPSLALGYIGEPEAEATAFIVVDDEHPCPRQISPALPHGRWYLTGDLASRDATGLITLIDRKSAVISTSEGKLVRSGQIEATLESVPGVQHALVHASPEWLGIAVVLSLASDMHLSPMAIGEVIEHPEHARHALAALGDSLGLHWQVGVTNAPWTAAEGLLSGELKKKRTSLLAAYAPAIKELHTRGDRIQLHGLPTQ